MKIWDAADDTGPIPPRTLTERLRLAIRWCRDYHAVEDDPAAELAAAFARHLDHLELKSVWKDGPALTAEQICSVREPKNRHQTIG